MTETTGTNRFALLFFLYFLGSSVAMAMIPAVRGLSYSTHAVLTQLVCFLPPLFLYFFLTKKNIKTTLRLNPLG